MIVPDYENMEEERICQECYGYAKGGLKVSFPLSLTDLISLYLKFSDRSHSVGLLNSYFRILL